MLNTFDSPVDRYSTFFFYVFFIILFSLATFWFGSHQYKSTYQKVVFYLSIIIVIVSSIMLLQAIYPIEILNRIASNIAIIILPLSFILAGLGIMIYGIAAILNHQTFVKFSLMPTPIKGPFAMYLGICWTIAGAMMILLV
jgi:hypothetical protein